MGRSAAPLWLAGLFLSLATTVPGLRASHRAGDGNGYVGRDKCASCHKKRGRRHASSRHRKTWQRVGLLDSVPGLPQRVREGGVEYSIEKAGGRWSYVFALPGRPPQALPIHSLVGGNRFGLSFILQVDQIESLPLARSTLVEARYMLEAGTHRLKLSPGFPVENPTTYEDALGRVMSPTFAAKCLGCHSGAQDAEAAAKGDPQLPFADTGVGCERCHGPGEAHLRAVAAKSKDLEIIHPGKLSNRDLMKICANCHTGFFQLVHPRPDDVLISAQVTALESSECYIQSDAGFSCISCHDPHRNATASDPVYQEVCLDCHSQEMTGNRTCPVNPASGCIGCHMPSRDLPGSFHLTDHWIRVVRE